LGLTAWLGCWLHERWRAELVLRFPAISRRLGLGWLDLHNRRERLLADATTGGRICQWADSSSLTVAKCFPGVGSRLLRHCWRHWPIEFTGDRAAGPTGTPEVTLVMAVRGRDRMPQFDATLGTLLAQRDCAIEIVVVEQSWQREFQTRLPVAVRYLHCPSRTIEMPFNKSWALNTGVSASRGELVLLHDADYLAPTYYAASVRDCLQQGLDACLPTRFLFYLDRAATERVCRCRTLAEIGSVNQVVQNNPTPLGLRREAFWAIGGMDESFFGWGGEDNEFLDRVAALRLGRGGFLPLVHLWHPAAPNRSGDRNAGHLEELRTVPVVERIARLKRAKNADRR
jgi:hypothetical protein